MGFDIQPQGERWNKIMACDDADKQREMICEYIVELQNKIKNLEYAIMEFPAGQTNAKRSAAWERCF